jgi:hypothetical protein
MSDPQGKWLSLHVLVHERIVYGYCWRSKSDQFPGQSLSQDLSRALPDGMAKKWPAPNAGKR